MPALSTDKEKLIVAIGEPVSMILEITSSFEEKSLNKIPFKGSWTAAQLLDHLTKFIERITSLLKSHGKSASRNISEKIPELKQTFLDFKQKMEAPDFIRPDKGPFNKRGIMEHLNEEFEIFITIAKKTDETQLLEKTDLGAVTKWELLHVALYHTERHLHQMRKIGAAINKMDLKA